MEDSCKPGKVLGHEPFRVIDTGRTAKRLLLTSIAPNSCSPGDQWEDDFVMLADVFPIGFFTTMLTMVMPGLR